MGSTTMVTGTDVNSLPRYQWKRRTVERYPPLLPPPKERSELRVTQMTCRLVHMEGTGKREGGKEGEWNELEEKERKKRRKN